MKSTLFSVALCLLFAVASTAQVRTPAPSPSAKVDQTIGLTEVSVEYSRPSVKDREIFGNVVPYNEYWRTGANAATKISFSEDVVVGGVDVAKGEYAIIAKPGEKSWELNFYPWTGRGWTSYRDGDVAPVKAMTDDVVSMPFSVESMMVAFDNLRNSSATLHFVWEKTNAYVTIEVPTDKAVSESITTTMAGPSANDYRAAASYYLAEDKDLEQALEWINQSLEMGGERFWILRDKSEIQAKLGDYAGAVKTAERSKELAIEAHNNDYVKINEDNIGKWSKK